jgi:hypothetical protein
LARLHALWQAGLLARRIPDPARSYYLWTRKVAGKTVTVHLTAEQAARCQPWTRNMRTLDRLLRVLQAVGLRAAAAVTRRS